MEAWIGLENSKDVGVVRMERAVDRMLAEGFGYSLVRIGDFGIRRTGGARAEQGLLRQAVQSHAACDGGVDRAVWIGRYDRLIPRLGVPAAHSPPSLTVTPVWVRCVVGIRPCEGPRVSPASSHVCACPCASRNPLPRPCNLLMCTPRRSEGGIITRAPRVQLHVYRIHTPSPHTAPPATTSHVALRTTTSACI